MSARRHRTRGNALLALVAGFLGVVVGAGLVLLLFGADRLRSEVPAPGGAASSPGAPVELAAPVPGSVPDAVAKVEAAVVNIDTTVQRRVFEGGPWGPFGPGTTRVEEVPQGMGTGVLVSEDGVVLTNNHVIQRAQGITVTLADNRQFKARVLGTDPLSDLAILRIEGEGPFPIARLGQSEALRIGEQVVALGNPVGVGRTVTVGVLSARGRSLSDMNVELRDLLQTDAAINPGNSGGPLVNLKGEVIGINTAIIPYAQGIGFAIPAETAARIMADLADDGKVTRPFLGIEMGDLTPPMRQYLELPPEAEGVVVGRILPDGPADRAGMQSGDVVMAVDGEKVKSARDLQALVRESKVGQELRLNVLRQGRERELQVELQETPSRLLPGGSGR